MDSLNLSSFNMSDVYMKIKNIETITDLGSRLDIIHNGSMEILIFFRDDLAKIEHILEFKVNEDCEIVNELSNKLVNFVSILESLIYLLRNIDTLISDASRFPKTIAEILWLVFSHCKNSESLYSSYFKHLGANITNVFKKCHELQIVYFVFITGYHKFNLNEVDQIEDLLDVLKSIVDIGEIVNTLDIKTMAEGWKGYVKICEKYSECLRDKFIHQKAIEILTAEIKNNVNLLVFNNIQDQKTVVKCLKCSNFVLKIMIKLSELFSGNLSLDYENIITNIIFIFQYSTSNLIRMGKKSDIIEGIRSHVEVGIKLFVMNLLSDHYFRTSCYKSIRELVDNPSLRYGCLLLIVTIMKLLLQTNENIRMSWTEGDQNNIISLLFDIITHCYVEILDDYHFKCMPFEKISLYDHILIHTACLAITCNDLSTIENKLFKSLFGSNIVNAIFSSDLFVILARYGSAEFCYDQVLYFSEIFTNSNYVKLLKNTVQLHLISHVLSKLFSSLPETYKLKVLEKYPLKRYPYVWMNIGLCNMSNKRIIHDCEEEIGLLTYNSSNLVSDYDKMIVRLQLISTINYENIFGANKTIKDSIYKCISTSWDRIESYNELELPKHEETICKSQWFFDYVLTICDITNNFLPYTTNELWLKVFQACTIHMNNSQVKIATIHLLNNFLYFNIVNDKHANNLKSTISALFKSLLNDKNDIIQFMAQKMFIDFVIYTSNIEVTANVLNNNKEMKNILIKYKSKSTAHYVSEKFLEDGDQFLKDDFKHRCDYHHSVKTSMSNTIQAADNNLDYDNISRSINRIKDQLLCLKNTGLKIQLNNRHKDCLREIDSVIKELLE